MPTWTSSSRPGWRRSSTRSPAASARGCRSCAPSTTSCAIDIDKDPDGAAARSDRRGLLARPPDGHQARPERAVPRLLAVPGAQGDPAGAGRRAAAPGGHRRGLPGVRPGHARQQERPVRAVRRLLALPRVQVHQEGRPAAARSAPVRGRLPEEQGRPPRAASRATDRERLLGVLELPALRLHDEQRAARRPARHRRRPAGPQGRDGDLPHLRVDQRCGCRPTSCPGTKYPGGPAEPRSPGSAGPRARRGTGGGAAKTGGRARGGARSGGRTTTRRTRPVEPAADA